LNTGKTGQPPTRGTEVVSGSHPGDRLRRSLPLSALIWLVVSSVVGSGIFFTPGTIAGALPHPGLIFLAWLAGGLISLAGALANAELGAMFPRAGGNYVYLREAYHPLAGFMVGWLTFFVIYVGTIATLAAAFAAGLNGFLELGATGKLALAVGVVLLISAFNYLGVRWGALANSATALLKLGAMLALAVAALWSGQGQPANLDPLVPVAGDWSLLAFGAALAPVLFSYLGWNASIYVASEIRDPARNVPRSLFLGLAICVLVYLLMNAVYLYALPPEQLRGAENAGVAAAQALFGPAGAILVGGLVIASVLGTLNAMILVGPRVAYAMAIDGLFFRGVEAAHRRFHTPHVAIQVQAVAAVALLVVMERFPESLFLSALSYTTFAILLATLADVSALYRLRRTRPDALRPYRAWGYPWVPALYLLANAAIALALLLEQPWQCLIGLLVALTGLPFYFLFAQGRPQPGAAPMV
jgi:APA family basic amino acid/polyamine antiporter